MKVTVYTDASFHAAAARGTWAFHALGERDGIPIVFERYGGCPRYCLTAQHAELCAILAAASTLPKAFPGIGLASVFSDCQFAIELVQGTRKPSAVEGPLVRKIHACGLAMRFTWIPAHQHGSTNEHAKRNNRVDYLAKRTLGELLSAEGINLPRRRDTIRALSPPDLVELHTELRTALAKRFGGNGSGQRKGRAFAWTALGLQPIRSARVHDLTREQAETVLVALRSTT